jgi:phosphoribosylanthranilate isomerase
MGIKLKVCGMKHAENIRNVAALVPDYMGFIFYHPSPRFVDSLTALPVVNPKTERVFVFVNETLEKVMNISRLAGVTHVQLHGQESPSMCAALQDQGFTVIKALSIHSDFDFSALKHYNRNVSYFLFDTKGKHPGGNAVRFDWKILERYHQKIPFFLSGGLSEENLDEIELLREMNLYALDVNSGVEISPGVKDINKVESVQRWLNRFNKKVESN